MNINRYQKNNSGFTLIKLVVVIAIMGVLAAIAIPAFFAWRPNYQLRRAARDIFSHMQMLKMEAIKRNQNIAINFNPITQSYNYTLPGGSLVTINLSTYGNGISYGAPGAASSAPGFPPIPGAIEPDGISYVPNSTAFTSRGNVTDVGYVYLQNDQGTCYAIGTPLQTGVARLLKWGTGSQWQ